MTAILEPTKTFLLRDLANATRQKLEIPKPKFAQADLKYADGAQTLFAFQKFLGDHFTVINPALKCLNDVDGWGMVCQDSTHGEIWLRLRPVLHGYVFHVMEARTSKHDWREFWSLSDLSLLIQIFDPCPF
jgi:hypothetical protein